ncbi:MAG: glycosyl transferase family 90 [Helicobacter sp.]|nr:glycosyl transferase family 90 [Helicobacter sp.]
MSQNLLGLYHCFIPKFSLQKKLKNLNNFSDKKLLDIAARVNYYCNFKDPQKLKMPQKSRLQIIKSGSRYAYDFYNLARFFPKHLRDFNFLLDFGDVNYEALYPTFCKSRPIKSKSNNIILKLDSKRHFGFAPILDDLDFSAKSDILFFRGSCLQEHRQRFLKQFYDHKLCDIGHTGAFDPAFSFLEHFRKPRSDVMAHLKHKFILSLQGNDVATNLKWILSTNSIALMPRPDFESWFMEGKLIPNVHYLQIRSDFSDVIDKITSLSLSDARAIIAAAKAHAAQFSDQENELLIGLLVLRKFFYKTDQMQVSKIEEELFKEN